MRLSGLPQWVYIKRDPVLVIALGSLFRFKLEQTVVCDFYSLSLTDGLSPYSITTGRASLVIDILPASITSSL